jgi:hypothetical protein
MSKYLRKWRTRWDAINYLSESMTAYAYLEKGWEYVAKLKENMEIIRKQL